MNADPPHPPIAARWAPTLSPQVRGEGEIRKPSPVFGGEGGPAAQQREGEGHAWSEIKCDPACFPLAPLFASVTAGGSRTHDPRHPDHRRHRGGAADGSPARRCSPRSSSRRRSTSSSGGRVLLKAECLQRTGSFKFRGAWNRISQLGAGDAQRRGRRLFVRKPRPGRGGGGAHPQLSRRHRDARRHPAHQAGQHPAARRRHGALRPRPGIARGDRRGHLQGARRHPGAAVRGCRRHRRAGHRRASRSSTRPRRSAPRPTCCWCRRAAAGSPPASRWPAKRCCPAPRSGASSPKASTTMPARSGRESASITTRRPADCATR